MSSASRLLRSQLLGYNGHQYLCDIDVSTVTVFVGDNWCDWSFDLLHAIEEYEGAIHTLERQSIARDEGVFPIEILGLEHDLYEIIFRTMSSELVDMVKEYVAVKTHRLERRGSIVYDILKQLCRCQMEGEPSKQNQVETRDRPDEDPLPLDVVGQAHDETVQDYGNRLLALEARIHRHIEYPVAELDMISMFIEGLYWDEDIEAALTCMKRDPSTTVEQLIDEIKCR